MPKQKKVKIECDHCEETCTIHFNKNAVHIQCCPFCGESVTVPDGDDRPLLNSFEDLDEFSEARFYDEDEDIRDDEDE